VLPPLWRGLEIRFFYCNPYNSLRLIHQRRDIAVYSSSPGKIKLSRRILRAKNFSRTTYISHRVKYLHGLHQDRNFLARRLASSGVKAENGEVPASG
jgi:hypothetical protein